MSKDQDKGQTWNKSESVWAVWSGRALGFSEDPVGHVIFRYFQPSHDGWFFFCLIPDANPPDPSPPPPPPERRPNHRRPRIEKVEDIQRKAKQRSYALALAPKSQGELVTVIIRGAGISTAAFSVFKMSYGSTSLAAGAKSASRHFEYGRTHVVRPKGRHQATIVWLHGLGDNGASWSQLLETLPLPNIKWICPTAPTRPVAVFGGFPCTAWFDVGELSEDGPDDVEGMDASAAHVANLLSTEPADIKIGVGGFSMGAATALYSATCFTNGKYGNGNPYPVNLSAVVGLSGWLPCSRSLKNKVESSQAAARQAASLPLLLCHGTGDEVVLYKHGERSAEVFKSTNFQNLAFKTYNGLGHYTIPEEMEDVCKWLTATLGLDGSRS